MTCKQLGKAMARQRRTSASQILGAMEFSPIRTLVRQAKALEKNDPNSKELRALCVELLQYELPKLKAVDANVAVEGQVTVTIGTVAPIVGDQDGD